MKNKSLSFIFTIIALTTLCSSCSAQSEAHENKIRSSNSNRTPKTAGSEAKIVGEIDTSNWKIYKDAKNGFSFRYPPSLSVEKKRGGVRLYHAVEFPHQNPCDGRDDPPTQKNLVDFDVRIKIVNQSFQSRKWEESDRDAAIKLGKANQNTDGKIVSHGYDGCGYDEYIYPLDANKSFVAEYRIIGLFSPVYADFPGAREALQHPDLLKNEEKIVEAIFESFEFFKR